MWYNLTMQIQIPEGATSEQLQQLNIPWAMYEEFKRVGVECALFTSPVLVLMDPARKPE
jgi:hypothetical protein